MNSFELRDGRPARRPRPAGAARLIHISVTTMTSRRATLRGPANNWEGLDGHITGRAIRAGEGPRTVAALGADALGGGARHRAQREPQRTPSDPDGTASFVRKGGSGDVLVNNHEVSGTEPFRVPHVAGFVYDETTFGGTTTIEVDNEGNRVREYVSLAGTSTNCAGGKTPWDTWLTCEETEEITGKRHGYVFEVDPYDQEANRDPKPIKALGRYAHESVVVDPRRGTVYLTEDATAPNGLLYRWTPPGSAQPLRHGSLRALADDAGTLEALTAFSGDTLVPDLSVATEPGTTYEARWVAVPERDATTVSTRKQFADGTITRSPKLEGMWWSDDGAYFVASFARTSDGSAAQHDGQVWFIDPDAGTIELKLHFAFTRPIRTTTPMARTTSPSRPSAA